MLEIKAVTFDAGGTLIEPWPSVGAIYAQVASEFGLDCSAEQLTSNFLDTWSARSAFRYTRQEWAEVVRDTFAGIAEISDRVFDAIYERFAEPRSWLIYDDVIPTLQALERTGLRLAVISNWDERLEPLLQKLGLGTYFRHIIVSSQLGFHKPDQRIFLRAAELLGISPNAILHIGDSLREDVEGARSVGMNPLRIRRSGKEQAFDVAKLTTLLDLLRVP